MTMKKLVIKKATRKEAIEQFELRVERMRSEVNILLSRKMLETIDMKKGFTSEELSEFTGESCSMMNKRVNTLITTHGLVIMNLSKTNDRAIYKLVAFSMPQKKKRYEKKIVRDNPVLTNPETFNPLINQVFC